MKQSFQTELVAAILMVLGDGILRLLSLATWPGTPDQWQAVVVKPEIVNAVIIVLGLGLLRKLPNYPGGAWAATSAVALALVTTVAHRLVLGPSFSVIAMVMTGVIFAALALLSLTLAAQWSGSGGNTKV